MWFRKTKSAPTTSPPSRPAEPLTFAADDSSTNRARNLYRAVGMGVSSLLLRQTADVMEIYRNLDKNLPHDPRLLDPKLFTD